MGTSGRPEQGSSNDIVLLLQQTQSLIAAFAAQEEAARKGAAELEAHAEQAERDAAKLAENAKAAEESTKKQKEAARRLEQAYDSLGSRATDLGKRLLDISEAGLKYAQTVGVSATKGVQTELSNRVTVFKQLFTTELNRMSNLDELRASEAAAADAFIGFREGMQASSDGAQALGARLKGGFNSDFQVTGASLKALAVIGATTEGQMESFRRATGRASLSSNQLTTIVNKNSLSFLLYGNKFAKAAPQAEMMGISLESIQNAQKGLVTNLDNTIDTVAQLNQLGADVDFGTLVRIAEQEGPDALLRYVQSTVPQTLLQSTSFRSLFEQLGISSEQLLRANQVGGAAESLQSQMSETSKKTGFLEKGFTLLGRVSDGLTGSFGGLFLSTVLATFALYKLSRMGGSLNGALELFRKRVLGITGPTPPTGGPVPPAMMGGLARIGLGIAGLSVAIAGIAYGIQKVQEGKTKTGIGIGAAAGAIGALMTGAAILGAIPTGGMSLALLGGGALAGGSIAYGLGKNDDMFSGYGNRTLLTPSGAYALNNRDTVIAGTNLFRGNDVTSFGEGQLNLTNPAVALLAANLSKSATNKSSELEKKIDQLITTIQNANTVININDTKTQTNRMAVVSVQTTRGG